jgi:hypothetical protein
VELKDKAEDISYLFFLRYQTKHQTTGQPYPDGLRKFALSLHLKSARAYRYRSSVFQVVFQIYIYNSWWVIFLCIFKKILVNFKEKLEIFRYLHYFLQGLSIQL